MSTRRNVDCLNNPASEGTGLEFVSHNATQTRSLGTRLGEMLQMGDLVCLTGDLGAGKTTLVQGIAAGWGSLDQASSPTFVLVNVYRRKRDKQPIKDEHGDQVHHAAPDKLADNPHTRPVAVEEDFIYHLDAYRLSGAAEALDLDLDTLLESGPLIIEWADRILPALPEERLWINLGWLSNDPYSTQPDQALDTRRLELRVHCAPGSNNARYQEMLSELVAFWNGLIDGTK
jgi:tRNA threonylcarbamoyladenosine biosynthesis protein TsaE